MRITVPVPKDFDSDGCTVPWFLKWLFRKYTPVCRRHDWCRRHLVYYRILTVEQADALLKREWKAMGMPSWLATISWNVVKWTRDEFSDNQPIPNDKPHWSWFVEQARKVDLSGTG